MTREYANIWTRFGAIVIDSLLLIPFYIPIFVLTFTMEARGEVYEVADYVIWLNMLFLFSGFVFFIWNTIIRMGKTGQSFGRKFLNIAVLDQTGQPIGVGKAFLREIIGRWISGLICYIGYLNAFWDSKNQMWHDKMASCYVFYVEDKFS